MNEELQRIQIAEVCGWKCEIINNTVKPITCYFDRQYTNCGGTWHRTTDQWKFALELCKVPDYPNDLNAMYQAEKVLNTGQINTYIGHLYSKTEVAFIESDPWRIVAARIAVHSTAAERAEAFLRTFGLWDHTQL